MTTFEIVQIIISIITLLVTGAVPIMIYWMQSRHEKEIKNLEERRIRRELEEKAHAFLSENNEERALLPLCAIASNLHRHDSYKKAIFRNFCRCPIDLQNEILKQANIEMKVPTNSNWVNKCFESFGKDREKHKLGMDFLYDGAKYFHRNYERYREQDWENLEYRKDFRTIAHRSNNEAFFGRDVNDISFIDYVDEYFNFLYSEYRPQMVNPNPTPPFDYIWVKENLATADERNCCRWVLEAVYDTVIILHNRTYGSDVLHKVLGDLFPETTAEQYYLTLLWMYFTYCRDEAIVEDKKETRKKQKPSKKE